MSKETYEQLEKDVEERLKKVEKFRDRCSKEASLRGVEPLAHEVLIGYVIFSRLLKELAIEAPD